MNRLFLLVLAACASTPPPVAAPPPVVKAAPPQLAAPASPARLLRDSATAYATASSYVDHGEQITVFDGGKFTERRTFTTAFVRPSAFRFEYREDGSAATAYIIWSDGTNARTQWYLNGGRVQPVSSLELAIAGATGVSGGTAYFVPSLLGLVHGTPSLIDPRYEGTESIDGHPCWKVSGSTRGGTMTYWIDGASHLVRRMFEKKTITGRDGKPFDVETTTTYQPTAGADVDVALLAPPDGMLPPQRPQDLPAWVGITFDTHVNTPRIQTVIAGGPAERAGIHVGDVVTSVDGAPLSEASAIVQKLRGHKSGEKVHIVLARDGKDVALDVTMEPRPDFAAIQKKLVGTPAPDFTLPVLSGPPIDRKGRVVIVDFWATWCGPCTFAMPRLVALAHKYKDLRIVGISSEDEADIKKFVAENKIDYTIAHDAGDTVSGRYFVTGLPTLVIVDKAGIVRYVHVGAGDFGEIEAQVQQYLK